MRTKTLLAVASALAYGYTVPAWSAGCDPEFTDSLNRAIHFVDSIRTDKPGVARVYATDGSEFTAGQVLWMKGQLRTIQHACTHSPLADSTERLGAVQGLIRAHARVAR